MRINEKLKTIILTLVIGLTGIIHATEREIGEKEHIIVKYLQENKDYALQTRSVVKPKEGSYTDELIFMDLTPNELGKNTFPVVGKVFHSFTYSDYCNEIDSLKVVNSYIEHINNLLIEKNNSFPYFIKYIDKSEIMFENSKIGTILLTEAKGITLQDLLADESLENISAEIISESFKTIGEQLGNLDASLYKSNDKKLFMCPDRKTSNFMYEINDKQLYFIDLAGSNFIDMKEKTPDLEEMYSLLLRDICNSIYHLSHHIFDLFNPNLIDSERELLIEKEENNTNKKLLALQNMFLGYELALKAQNINYDGNTKLNKLINEGGILYEKKKAMKESYIRLIRNLKEFDNIVISRELNVD